MASERRFVAENVRRVLLKEYLMKEVSRAGFGGLDVQRTPMGTRVILTTERPGLVIGRKGQTIKNLTMAIEDQFGFENPQIEVQEVPNPSLNAQIMAEKLAFSLERGWHFRRAGHSTVRRIMDSGAKGCYIILAGKLTGQRHRTEKFREGNIKYCGEPKALFMEHGYAVAQLKMGIIGVTVNIMNANSKLPAETTVLGKTEAAAKLPQLFADEPVAAPAAAPAAVAKPQAVAEKEGQ
jgi:small subunit ribosomal protein S3